ncbi:hypothetical protein Micbo1qcDRAFT_210118 [Microdochium bolleyi]|uniref:Uncharacterized protein n=1 Tax=Microdochium bolleyi TaxID=196109 RepID=A0A136IJY0_9PEZI|nr:hypothetical protein Micbo1qcDRAFT_210118 [Microdochium bolleyi]
MAGVIQYTNNYSQVFHHKGVDLSPEGHAEGRLAEYRAATVEACRLDPAVGSIQYNSIVKDGVGAEWAVVFKDEKFNITVHYDNKKKNRWTGVRTRTIGYTLSLSVIQECRPIGANPARIPRHIGVSLADEAERAQIIDHEAGVDFESPWVR